MDAKLKQELLAYEYQVFVVRAYEPGESPELDDAVRKVPQEFSIEGSLREKATGGKELKCVIDLENDNFVVYLPPEDVSWVNKSQFVPPGFSPSQKRAEYEFKRWLEHVRQH